MSGKIYRRAWFAFIGAALLFVICYQEFFSEHKEHIYSYSSETGYFETSVILYIIRGLLASNWSKLYYKADSILIFLATASCIVALFSEADKIGHFALASMLLLSSLSMGFGSFLFFIGEVELPNLPKAPRLSRCLSYLFFAVISGLLMKGGIVRLLRLIFPAS